jgi:hypothetical protein
MIGKKLKGNRFDSWRPNDVGDFLFPLPGHLSSEILLTAFLQGIYSFLFDEALTASSQIIV